MWNPWQFKPKCPMLVNNVQDGLRMTAYRVSNPMYIKIPTPLGEGGLRQIWNRRGRAARYLDNNAK